jgi:hypothetical protein
MLSRINLHQRRHVEGLRVGAAAYPDLSFPLLIEMRALKLRAFLSFLSVVSKFGMECLKVGTNVIEMQQNRKKLK